MNKSTNLSTDYYRKNRISKMVCHKCPFEGCNYETTNCKIVLTNHINSFHVEEKDRPYQCTHCDRGFAQKAHLVKHVKREHEKKDTTILTTRISTILYLISTTNVIPSTKKTRSRREYYIKHGVLKGRDIFNKKHEYSSGCFLKNHDLHYDLKKGFITFEKVKLVANSKSISNRQSTKAQKRGRYNY